MTADAIGEILPLAVGVALSPVPIIAVVLLLATPRGRMTGGAFAAGWLMGSAALGALCLLVAGQADATEGREPSDWTGVLKLALGMLLIALAVRQWRGRSEEVGDQKMPGWMTRLDAFTAPRAFALAAAASSLNPKNLGLTIGAAVTIAETGLDPGDQAAAMAVFTGLASLGVVGPIVAYLALGERASGVLDALKSWMLRYYPAIVSMLLLVLGVTLLGKAVGGLL